jgi:hypothetical protein
MGGHNGTIVLVAQITQATSLFYSFNPFFATENQKLSPSPPSIAHVAWLGAEPGFISESSVFGCLPASMALSTQFSPEEHTALMGHLLRVPYGS